MKMILEDELFKVICSKEYANALYRIIVNRCVCLRDAIELLKESKDIEIDSILIMELSNFGYNSNYIAGYMSCLRVLRNYNDHKKTLTLDEILKRGENN